MDNFQLTVTILISTVVAIQSFLMGLTINLLYDKKRRKINRAVRVYYKSN